MTLQEIEDRLARRWEEQGKDSIPHRVIVTREDYDDLREALSIGRRAPDPTTGSFTMSTDYGTIEIISQDKAEFWHHGHAWEVSYRFPPKEATAHDGA